MQQRLPLRAAQHLYVPQAQPVGKTCAQSFNGGFLGGEAPCKIGDRAFRHGGLFQRGENFLLKPFAKPIVAGPDTRKLGNIRSKSYNHKVIHGGAQRPGRVRFRLLPDNEKKRMQFLSTKLF